jgi:hypothetical protein
LNAASWRPVQTIIDAPRVEGRRSPVSTNHPAFESRDRALFTVGGCHSGNSATIWSSFSRRGMANSLRMASSQPFPIRAAAAIDVAGSVRRA